MTDEELLNLMESLTGWNYDPWSQRPGMHTAFTGVEMTPKETCYAYPENWYAYMGLMETYDVRFTKLSILDTFFGGF